MAPLPTHLRRYRRAWALSQRELGALLGGMVRESVARYERLSRMPSCDTLIALEFIFAVPAHDLFPGVGLSAIRAVRDNAVALRDALLSGSDSVSARKRRLLDDLIIRSASLLSHYD